MDDNIVATPLVGGESEICGKDAKILNINMGNEPNGVQKSETVYNPLVSAEVEEVHESVLASRLEDTSAWATDIFQLKRTGGNKVNEKNIKLGRLSIILLFTLGVAAGLINGCILMANHALCKFQAQLVVTGGYFGIGLLYFMIAMSVSVMLAAMGCHYGAKAAAGSGLPEFKYLLASELRRSDYEKLISLRIFIFKVFGLIFSVGGGLSVGSEGPLVHTASCIAHLLMKYIAWFDEIMDSPSLTKQILAASAAVGVSSAFNAPVGGLLFSVETTAIFYLVSNYWRSFIAAMAGSVACNLFLITNQGVDSDPLLVLQMKNLPTSTQYQKWEIIIFIIMGVIFGLLAHGYLYLHQRVAKFMRPHNRSRPITTAIIVAVLTSFFVYITGSYSPDSVGILTLVSDALNSGKLTEMRRFGVEPTGGLLVNFFLRVGLTLLGTNILVPAGIFMPVHLIGAVLGRFIGYLIYYCGHTKAFIPGYALVGAVAFASGITHTISAAVIAVEMTGNIAMLLPCLIVAVISAGITKSLGLSVYDIGMLAKGLDTFQLLLSGRGAGNRIAADVMDEKAISIARKAHILELVKLLELSPQQVFPMIDENSPNMKLVGTVRRRDIFVFLKRLFTVKGFEPVIRVLLPVDTREDDEAIAREEKREALRKRRDQVVGTFKQSIDMGDSFIQGTQSFLFDGPAKNDTHNPIISSSSSNTNNSNRNSPDKSRRSSSATAHDGETSPSNKTIKTSLSLPKLPSSEFLARFSQVGCSGADGVWTADSFGSGSSSGSGSDSGSKSHMGSSGSMNINPTGNAVSGDIVMNRKVSWSAMEEFDVDAIDRVRFQDSDTRIPDLRLSSFTPLETIPEGTETSSRSASARSVSARSTTSNNALSPARSLSDVQIQSHEDGPTSAVSAVSASALAALSGADIGASHTEAHPTAVGSAGDSDRVNNVSDDSKLFTGDDNRIDSNNSADRTVRNNRSNDSNADTIRNDSSSPVQSLSSAVVWEAFNSAIASFSTSRNQNDTTTTGNRRNKSSKQNDDFKSGNISGAVMTSSESPRHRRGTMEEMSSFVYSGLGRVGNNLSQIGNMDFGVIEGMHQLSAGVGNMDRGFKKMMGLEENKEVGVEGGRSADSAANDSTQPLLVALFQTEVDVENEPALQLNRFPFSVSEQTPMDYVYVLFEMVRAPAIFVLCDGGLKGMISRERLIESLRDDGSS